MKINNREEGLHALKELGLTRREAEVYLVLLTLGQLTASLIAQQLQIARAEVYRSISKIEKLGLIEKTLTSPVMFKAFPITVGISILVGRREKRSREIQNEARKLMDTFKLVNGEERFRKGADYVLAYGWEIERYKLVKHLENAQTSLDCVIPMDRFMHAFADLFEDFEKTLKRGLKVRFITNFPQNATITKTCDMLKKAGDFELRFVQALPSTIVTLTDGKALNITLALSDSAKVHNLCTEELDLIETFRDYFELKWRSAVINLT